jgi:hypothetical protein
MIATNKEANEPRVAIMTWLTATIDEETKGAISSRKSKDRQSHDQRKEGRKGQPMI